MQYTAALPVAFVAGAMVYMVDNDIVLESHGRGYSQEAMVGAMVPLEDIFVA